MADSIESRTTTEIASQPDSWRRAAALVPQARDVLPRSGERVAVVGCGTSWFMATAYARLREDSGQGETDAFAASEFPMGRRYDRVLAITRSGTTSAPASRAVQDGERAVAAPLDPQLCDAEQLTFPGAGWTYGLALDRPRDLTRSVILDAHA